MTTFDEEIELPKRKDEGTIEQPAQEENAVSVEEPTVVEPVVEPVAEPAVLDVVEPPVENTTFPEVQTSLEEPVVEPAVIEPPAPEVPEPILETPPILEKAITEPEGIIVTDTPVPQIAPVTEAPADTLTEPEAPVAEPKLEPAPSVAEMPLELMLDNNAGELDKKLVVEKPTSETKGGKSKLIGIISVILIIAILGQAIYFFVSQGYISLPWGSEQAPPPLDNPEPDYDPIPEPDVNRLFGTFTEDELQVCPDVSAELVLNEDMTFTFNNIRYSVSRRTCVENPVSGTFSADNGIIVFDFDDEEPLTATYTFEGDIVTIIITGTRGTEATLTRGTPMVEELEPNEG